MAFFDELGKKMSDVAQSAQKTAEIARLQRQVNLKQDDFDALFAQIGRLYYSCHQRGVQPAEEMDQLCGKVDALAAEIQGLKLKLDDLRHIHRCPGCGAIQHSANRFCANCGARLEDDSIPEEAPQSAESAPETSSEDAGRTVYIRWPNGGEEAKGATEAKGEAEREGGASTEEK